MATVNTILYSSYKNELSDINKILVSLTNLENIIKKYPTGTKASNLGDLYKTNFAKNSYGYTTLRKNTSNSVVDFIKGYSSSDPDSQEFMKELNGNLLSLPDKIMDALDLKDEVIQILDDEKDLLLAYKVTLVTKMNNAVSKPDVWDIRVPNLKARMDAVYQSSAIDGYVDRDLTLPVQQKRLDDSLVAAKKKDLEFKQLIAQIEVGTQIGTLLYQKFPQLTLKNVLLRRSVDSTTKAGRDALEDYWRSKVRKKYGKDVPFCDEVGKDGQPIKVKNSDGTEFFAKASDVIRGPNGDYQLIQTNRNETLKKSYNDTNLGAY